MADKHCFDVQLFECTKGVDSAVKDELSPLSDLVVILTSVESDKSVAITACIRRQDFDEANAVLENSEAAKSIHTVTQDGQRRRIAHNE